MNLSRYGLLIFFLALPFLCKAQTKIIDSLRQVIHGTVSEKEKLDLILFLGEQTINPDTLLPYLNTAEKIAARYGIPVDADKVANCKAAYYSRKNHFDSALLIADKLVNRYKYKKDQQHLYLSFLFSRAKILDRSNQYSKAISQLMDVIQLAETQNDTLLQIQAKTGIGWVQMEMEQYKEALQWFYKAMRTSASKRFYKNYSALYSNIASSYNATGNTDSAMYYINIAIKDARENENLLFLATALSIQAKIFIDNKKPKLAEAPLHEALAIRKKINDPFYIVYDMSNLAGYYAGNNQPQKGIALCLEGIELAKQRGLQSQLLMIYKALAENYKAAGKTQEYSHTLEDIIALKDSFNNINSAKQIAELQAKSEAQKKEKTIVEQKLNLTIKNYWLFGSVVFASMALVIFSMLFKSYRRKQSLRMQLALNDEKRKAAQSIIDAEEQERKRIAADLHDNIGAYASAIRADVERITDNHKGDISDALENLQRHSSEIINSLRDTIWVLNKENITITGISDRIKAYISKLQPSYKHIQIQVTESIENDVRIRSQNALCIFRIVQEAVHNALKHSQASHIHIGITSAKNIRISIEDDGMGMENAQPGREGNGLLNMKARAAEAGFLFHVSSSDGKGTVILLEPATTN